MKKQVFNPICPAGSIFRTVNRASLAIACISTAATTDSMAMSIVRTTMSVGPPRPMTFLTGVMKASSSKKPRIPAIPTGRTRFGRLMFAAETTGNITFIIASIF